jgi:hypothetical protein
MRCRFTTHIASMGIDYPAGREVEVRGKTYALDQVPELVGRQWLASGVLEPIAEAAAIRPPETAARAAAQPRRAAARN